MNLDEEVPGKDLAYFFQGFLQDNQRGQIRDFLDVFKGYTVKEKRAFCKLILRIADENREPKVISQHNDDVANFLSHVWIIGKAIDKTWRE